MTLSVLFMGLMASISIVDPSVKPEDPKNEGTVVTTIESPKQRIKRIVRKTFMIPDEWREFSPDDLFSFKNGLNCDKEDYGHGIKFVNVMDIFKNKRLYEKTIIGLVNATEKQLKEYSVQYGDVLFNRTSETFDEIAFSSVYLGLTTITFGGFVIRGRPLNNHLFPEYSIYCFDNRSIRKEFIRRGQGAVRANIGQKDLGRIRLHLPPLSEQTKIAKILSTWDKAIETVEKLIENGKQQKKALMQQLLTGKRRVKTDTIEPTPA